MAYVRIGNSFIGGMQCANCNETERFRILQTHIDWGIMSACDEVICETCNYRWFTGWYRVFPGKIVQGKWTPESEDT